MLLFNSCRGWTGPTNQGIKRHCQVEAVVRLWGEFVTYIMFFLEQQAILSLRYTGKTNKNRTLALYLFSSDDYAYFL
jgi:hypothetical protein